MLLKRTGGRGGGVAQDRAATSAAAAVRQKQEREEQQHKSTTIAFFRSCSLCVFHRRNVGNLVIVAALVCSLVSAFGVMQNWSQPARMFSLRTVTSLGAASATGVETTTTAAAGDTSNMALPTDAELRDKAKATYHHCSTGAATSSDVFVPPVPPRTNPSEWRKPLWVTSFPASGSTSPSNQGDLTKELIDAITGLSQATKNYHRSIAGGALRRCKGLSETAACTQGHPVRGTQRDWLFCF